MDSGKTELMENIDAISVSNLADHMGRIKPKMVARAIANSLRRKRLKWRPRKQPAKCGRWLVAGKGASGAGHDREARFAQRTVVAVVD